MKITLELLRDHGACVEQLHQFVRAYPQGLEPTVENIVELSQHRWHVDCSCGCGGSDYGFDVNWLVRLLSPEDQIALSKWRIDNIYWGDGTEPEQRIEMRLAAMADMLQRS